LRRDAEVVQRRRDHDDVRRQQFRDQRCAAGVDGLLLGSALFVGREERAERRVVEMRQVVGQQVAHDGLRAGVRLLQL